VISISTARELIDFGSGGRITRQAADQQLAGAVAIHNILEQRKVAYLADEVGMGKTYVAVGALALFRHFNPAFRMLLIAPRQNIQKKWLKELKNFTANNIRFSDLRTKALHGTPARAAVLCNSVVELVRETSLDPDRDFLCRLSSFSLALSDDPKAWREKRRQLIEHLPWLEPGLLDLRNKDEFKENFARAVCCALPPFDLVIVDEGHNLKGGYHTGGPSRNTVLALAFGHSRGRARIPGLPGYGHKAKRVLFLSATPLENDYLHLWNQLDVFGLGDAGRELRDQDVPDEQKRACAQRFLIRRVTTINVAGKDLTKNLYRSEWRHGGVVRHDEPLEVPDDRQRLAVALVQKKVSEVLGHARFNNSFQIGMLASFESFLQTSQVIPENDEEEANFDDPDQTDDATERLGVDVAAVNQLARSYRKRFQEELPHPKMDAVVRRLAGAFQTGEKALVFVRRVASVKELQRKLEEYYDKQLIDRLRRELKPVMIPTLDEIVRRYYRERTARREQSPVRPARAPSDDGPEPETPSPADEGGFETFFAWFFRGEGPSGVLSGRIIQERFTKATAAHATFFEDNHVAWLLGAAPGGVIAALGNYLRRDAPTLVQELRTRAGQFVEPKKKLSRLEVFLAYQQAALEMLAVQKGDLQERAEIVGLERYFGERASTAPTTRQMPKPDAFLEQATLWTELRKRPGLRQRLWPEPTGPDLRAAFREQELRRELFSAMARLGSAFIDLYILSVNRIARLELGAKDPRAERPIELATAFLDALEHQAGAGPHRFTAFSELADAASGFRLLLDVNAPSAWSVQLSEAARLFGGLLRRQQPVGGMFGEINETLVRQFRMPGYPLMLITTDLLQEGEDLHTFCSSVYHYGISWMPSSMEQRIGRIDRVGSQTERRLAVLGRTPENSELLQVYYPHLRDTVEVLQVERVLERMNRFLRMMHEELGTESGEHRQLDVANEILRAHRDTAPIKTPLRTAFPVRAEFLGVGTRSLAVSPKQTQGLLKRFTAFPRTALGGLPMTWEPRTADGTLMGTFALRHRKQPFILLLRSVVGRLSVRCISPIGRLETEARELEIARLIRARSAKVAAVYDPRFDSYNLTVEDDVLLTDQRFDTERVAALVVRVVEAADLIEERLLQLDQPMETFRDDLELEPAYDR
jgi:hypothetical protein